MSSSLLADVRAASRTVKEIPLVGMADGSNACLRVIVVRGRRDGPTVYIGAAIHGDEVCGIGVIRRLLAAIDLETLAGNVIAVPVQNPFAFFGRLRFMPTNAFDSLAVDAVDNFPGSPDGEINVLLAHVLLERLITQADYAVDLHAALPGGIHLEYCITPSGTDPRVRTARQLARMFATDLVMELDRETPHVGPKKLHQVATSRGTPAFSVELQQAGSIEEVSVKRGVAGFLNMFRFLGMLKDAAPVPPARQFIGTDYRYVRLRRPGLYTPDLPVGAHVEAGDVIGSVYDIYTDETEQVRAPATGLLYRVAIPRPLNGSERVASMALGSFVTG